MDSQAHVKVALRFLLLADFFTIEQDPLAKSEMLWCAAAHIVKAISIIQRPHWSNRSHDDLFRAAERAANLLGEPRVEDDFRAAGRLHRNMYEGFMGRRAIANAERRVRRFANRIDDYITSP